jgi:serine/threonine protein kinase
MSSTPPPTPEAEQPTVEAFLTLVLRSGLVTKDRLDDALLGLFEADADAAAVADHLVKRGLLSRFQAKKLLKGTAKGLILGPFQILAPIGKGGNSVVYLARDSRDDRLVALKVLPRKDQEPRRLARFRRELELSRRVTHPHLCRTFSGGAVSGANYIAMEYIPGRTLSRLVAEEGPLPPPRAARLLAQVAAGLGAAHEQGLIHRDLKPSNIMVTPQDLAKVLDLGLALMEGEEVADPTIVGGKGYIVGTVDYMAPEQSADATDVGPRSDVYALGCTLYYALTGRPPFPGGTRPERVRRHRTEDPAPVPGLPAGMGAALRKMLAKDPARRHPSARAVESELWHWADAGPEPGGAAVESRAFASAVAALQEKEAASDSWSEIPTFAPAEAPPPARGCFGALLAMGLLAAGLLAWLLTAAAPG